MIRENRRESYYMEMRGLQKTGGSSYLVTLPKQWVLGHSLANKGIVEIYSHPSGQLILRPHLTQQSQSAVLTIDYLSDARIEREMIGLYVAGVESILVEARSITYEQRALIRSVSYKLIGFELFDETSQRMTLKNVSNSTVAPAEYVNRILGIVRAMYEDIQLVMRTGDKRLARDIIERDVEVDRIHLVILRQFNQMLQKLVGFGQNELSLFDLHYYEIVSLRLERIADHIVRIAQTISLLREKEKVVLNKFEHANVVQLVEYLNILEKTISSLDKQQAHKLIDMYDSRKKNDFLSQRIIHRSSLNILIEDSIERIRGYISNIAEETINYSHLKEA